MPDFTVQAHLDATADRVWSFVADPDSWSRWNETHREFPGGAPTDLRAGDTFKEGVLMMNFPAEVTWSVDVLEPGRRLELSGPGSAGVKIRQTYALTPTPGGGTDVEVFYSVTGAAVALLGKKIREAGTRAVEESLQKLGPLCLT